MKYKNWIKSPERIEGAVISFRKRFSADGDIKKATLCVSSLGIYKATLNGKKVGNQVLTPGCTSYDARIIYNTYDVTEDIKNDNVIDISVGGGWAIGRYGIGLSTGAFGKDVCAVAELSLEMADGTVHYTVTDGTWEVYTAEVTFADLYEGETIDKTAEERYLGEAVVDDREFNLVPQMGADIRENEILAPVELIITPKGERVLDFGQNMTGYVSLKIKGKRGES